MKNIVLGPTEVIFLVGFFSFTTGIALQCGFAWGLIAAGSILLVTAFRNAAERDRSEVKPKKEA